MAQLKITAAAEPATVAGTISKLRREVIERYRACVRAVVATKPTKADLIALGEAAHELGLSPQEADEDVAALRSLALARQTVDVVKAREPEWRAEAKAAADEIERWQHKELPRLRGIVADRNARLSTIVGHMRTVDEIERANPRLFADPSLSLDDMAARRARALELQCRSSGRPW